MKTLLFGIGNNGRQDDGLGWAFAAACERAGLASMDIHYRYQMAVEDAEMLATAERVIFVDAHKGTLSDGFLWEKLVPSARFEFTSHVLPPASVLFLCEELYGRAPEAWLLLIEGEKWELKTGLSGTAKRNLEKAIGFLSKTWGTKSW